MKIRIFLLLMACCLFMAAEAGAAPFTVVDSTQALAAPASGAPAVADLNAGQMVEVSHQAGAYWRVALPGGKAGYVPASALKQSEARAGLLAPLVIAAAAPLGKVVLSGAINWFKQKIGLGSLATAQADQVLSLGQELFVLAREAGNWLKVKTAQGAIGYIQAAPTVVPLQTVQAAPAAFASVYQQSRPIPPTAYSLTLQVEIRKLDGTYVPPNGFLRKGEQYRIYLTPSADCYVRISCETPDHGHVCQYYPNRFPGTQTTMRLLAGRTYSTEFLPPGMNFQVVEPIGRRDIIRIEATTAAPFHYVPHTDGCAPTGVHRGGGFSVAGQYINPTAQSVVVYPIQTR